MGRNPNQNEEARNQMKSKIKSGAILFFAKYGYDGAKISDLAKYLKISQGLLYRYYASKEALFAEIINEWNARRDQQYEQLLHTDVSAKEKIIRITQHLELAIKSDEQLAAIFTIMENRSLVVGIDESFNGWASYPIQMLEKILKDGQREGSVYPGSCYQMSIAYWGLFSSICRDYISTNGDISSYDFNLLNRLLVKENI